ncbi:MAG: 3-phosphoglycerate dehydrogenase [Bacteroidales bacterium]
MKTLIATEKPFAKAAVDGIKTILSESNIDAVVLEQYTDKTQLLTAVADVDALIVRSDKVSKEVVEAAKKLKIVVRAGAGFDNIDLSACTAKGIVAMNTPGQNSNAVAELVLGLMIYMARNSFLQGTGSELKGKRLGIHAYGNIGRLVAKLAKGFGLDIYVFDPFVSPEDLQKDGLKCMTTVEELYASCDYISLHMPVTEKTRNFIGYSLLSSMPIGACLINTARKEVICEEELVRVFEERIDLKYATDIAADMQSVLEEKFSVRIFATPKKIGAETAEANVNAGLAAATQIVTFFKDGDTQFQVNK